MKRSDNIASISKAMSTAQSKICAAKKDSQNPHFKSRYADLASVWDACREQLTANKISVFQPVEVDEAGRVNVTTLLAHESGEWIESTLSLRPMKDDPQAVGSAITYGRRYGLAAMVGVAPDDDDGEAAMDRTRPQNGHTDDRRARQRPLNEVAGAKEPPKSPYYEKEFSDFLRKLVADNPEQWQGNQNVRNWCIQNAECCVSKGVKSWGEITQWDEAKAKALAEELLLETARRKTGNAKALVKGAH